MSAKEWIVNGLAASSLVSRKARVRLLRLNGARIGKCSIAFGGAYYGDLSQLRIGDGAFLNVGVTLFPTGGITIGKNVAIGPRTLIMTGTHTIGLPSKRASSPTITAPVVIGDGAWIGGGVIIQSGVAIGAGAVVGAGSVVIGDVEPDSFYAGVPAIKKSKLDAISR